MTIAQARELYMDSAQYYLHHVMQEDTQTIEDVLAVLDWPEKKKDIKWAAKYGRKQVFTSAIMNTAVTLTELKQCRTRST